MQITTVDNLSVEQLAQLCRLEKRSIAADGGRLKLEWGVLEAGRLAGAALAEHDGELAGYFGRYSSGGDRTEIAGVVDPQARGRGLGATLLTETLRLGAAAGERDALLVVRRDVAGGAELARHFGGRPHHSEHALVLTERPDSERPDSERPSVTVRPMTAQQWPQVRQLLADAFGYAPQEPAASSADRTLVIEHDGGIVGTLRTSVQGERADIYGFVVAAPLRGRGLGAAALARTCRGLFDGGAHAIGLEVAVDNERALGLYTRLGFRPVTTEDYYLVPV